MNFTTLLGIARPHILGIAGLAALTFGWVLGGRHDLVVPLFIIVDWFVVNLANRAVDIGEDLKNGVPGTEAVARRKRLVEAACFGLMAASLGLGHILAPETTAVRAVFHAIGVAYNYRILPGGLRFKNLYFFKNSMSATLFVLSCILAPALHLGLAPGVTWANVAWLAAFFFPLELTYEILYDLRDVEGDVAEGVRTYPVVHGETGARAIIWGLLALSGAVLVAGGIVGRLRLRELALFGGVVVQALIFLFWARAKRQPTVADCVQITWVGAALQLAYNGWIWAGLPLGA